MELRDIEYFAVLAEHGNVGRAAAALGISQPALSKCLQRLETALATKLVDRTTKGVELTAEGTALRLRANVSSGSVLAKRSFGRVPVACAGNAAPSASNAVIKTMIDRFICVIPRIAAGPLRFPCRERDRGVGKLVCVNPLRRSRRSARQVFRMFVVLRS